MAPLDLTKTELTPQESEDIRNEVARFEVLYEHVRDLRGGYHGGDPQSAIEKLYTQVTNMMEGN